MSPSCGISVNETGAHNFIAFRSIDKGEEITSITPREIVQSNFFKILAYVENQYAENLLTDGKDYLNKET